MKLMVMTLLCVAAFTLTACSDRAAELFETAQFEEKQNNRRHALELYEQIVRDYPGSDQAERAKERLQQLADEVK
jgi:TolA-binding protein